jgi:hypothetical protein
MELNMQSFLRRVPVRSALASVAVVVAVLAVGPLGAQGPRGRCRGQGMPGYDPATEVTLRAVVEAVEQVDCCCPRGGTGTHVALKVDGAPIRAHLGPSGYLAEKKMEIGKGEALEIVGSRVKCMGDEVILARTIKKGGRTLTLRDERGVPAWAGRGRGRTDS